VKAERSRLLAARARTDTREWVVTRRERTHRLIELGGLVIKAGIVDLTDDDRAVIFGGLLSMARTLSGHDRDRALLLWRCAGRREFDARPDE
jgi:hypothetical protein